MIIKHTAGSRTVHAGGETLELNDLSGPDFKEWAQTVARTWAKHHGKEQQLGNVQSRRRRNGPRKKGRTGRVRRNRQDTGRAS